MSAAGLFGALEGRYKLPEGYLAHLSRKESGGNPLARNPASTAGGQFQFIDDTWIDQMAKSGGEYGYDTSDPEAALALKFDPVASARMAGAFSAANADTLRPVLGRDPDGGELYLAHFLGPGGAKQFLSAYGNNPDAPAADLLPQAAKANQTIFYGKDGAPRSVGDTFEVLTSGFNGGGEMAPLNINPAAGQAMSGGADPFAAMMEMYQKRMQDLGQGVGARKGVSRDDIARMMVDAGAGMVAAGGRPGASFGGALGTGMATAGSGHMGRRDRDKAEYERLMERAGDLGIRKDDREYRRSRDTVGDEHYADDRDYRRERDKTSDDRQFAGEIYRRGRDTLEDKRYEQDRRDQIASASTKRDYETTKEYQDRVFEVAEEILKARKTDYAAPDLTMEDAYEEAKRLVDKEYGGASVDALSETLKRLEDTAAKITQGR